MLKKILKGASKFLVGFLAVTGRGVTNFQKNAISSDSANFQGNTGSSRSLVEQITGGSKAVAQNSMEQMVLQNEHRNKNDQRSVVTPSSSNVMDKVRNELGDLVNITKEDADRINKSVVGYDSNKIVNISFEASQGNDRMVVFQGQKYEDLAALNSACFFNKNSGIAYAFTGDNNRKIMVLYAKESGLPPKDINLRSIDSKDGFTAVVGKKGGVINGLFCANKADKTGQDMVVTLNDGWVVRMPGGTSRDYNVSNIFTMIGNSVAHFEEPNGDCGKGFSSMNGIWAVGCPGADGGEGKVYVFSDTLLNATVSSISREVTKIPALEESSKDITIIKGGKFDAQFGQGVKIFKSGSDTIIAISAPGFDSDRGKVEFWKREANGEVNKIGELTGAKQGDCFGSCVDVAYQSDGTKLAISAPLTDANNKTESGSIYVINFKSLLNVCSGGKTVSITDVKANQQKNGEDELARLGLSLSFVDNNQLSVANNAEHEKVILFDFADNELIKYVANNNSYGNDSVSVGATKLNDTRSLLTIGGGSYGALGIFVQDKKNNEQPADKKGAGSKAWVGWTFFGGFVAAAATAGVVISKKKAQDPSKLKKLIELNDALEKTMSQ